jgi:hypothetical protein
MSSGGLNVKWSEPVKTKTKYGHSWVRSWVIPHEYLEGFFLFWKKQRDVLRTKGYSISKNKNGRWCLNEWQISKKDFRNTFGQDNEKKEVKLVFESTLPPYKLKNTEGLREWQIPSAEKLCAALKKYKAAIDGSDTGCHAAGQPILMFDGKIKAVEDILVGEKIMGWDGTPREVLSLCRGRQKMAKIIPKKGQPWVVNMDHILTVKLTNGPSPTHKQSGGYKYGEIVDIKVTDYIKLKNATKHAMKLFTVGVDCWKEKTLSIDPYMLGVLLGDGGLTMRGTITITSADKEIWDYVQEYQSKTGGKLGRTNQEITKRLTNCPKLLRDLREMELNCVRGDAKFIPHDYKTGSRSQRLDILAGLIDTDGWREGCGFSLVSKSKILRDDVAYIARSLGFFVTTKTVQASCYYKGEKKVGTYYRCYITGDVCEIPTKINRKKPNTRIIKKKHNVTGFVVEELPEDNYYGFNITGDGRYLLGDFVVTHNTGKTYAAVATARELKLKIGVICPKSVISSWERVVKNHFKMEVEFVLNYESVKTGKYKNIGVWKPVSKISNKEYFHWNLPKNTLIIFDESHRLKGGTTINAQIAIQAKKQGYHILCCSATNAINPIELKATGYILELYKKNYLQYLRDHGCKKGRFGWEFDGDENVLKKLHFDLFMERGTRLRKEEIKGFPDCETVAEAYNVNESNEKELNDVYSEMNRELTMLSIKCKNTAEWKINAMVIQLRARQKAELLKVPLFLEMIEDAFEDGLSVAVFLNFTETIEALSKRLKTNCIVWGKNKKDERDKAIDAFQSDKERIILVNTAAGGAGLSLHDLNGKYPRMAIISPTPSAVNLRQVLGRIHRDGAKSKALQKIVFAANTEEEDVCENVKKKLHNLDIINDGDLLNPSFMEKYTKIVKNA